MPQCELLCSTPLQLHHALFGNQRWDLNHFRNNPNSVAQITIRRIQSVAKHSKISPQTGQQPFSCDSVDVAERDLTQKLKVGFVSSQTLWWIEENEVKLVDFAASFLVQAASGDWNIFRTLSEREISSDFININRKYQCQNKSLNNLSTLLNSNTNHENPLRARTRLFFWVFFFNAEQNKGSWFLPISAVIKKAKLIWYNWTYSKLTIGWLPYGHVAVLIIT